MKRVAEKNKDRNIEAGRRRDYWLYNQAGCAVCRFEVETAVRQTSQILPATEVHHITGRNAKANDDIYAVLESPQNWLPVCRIHHQMLQSAGPLANIVAAASKKRSDPEHYDPVFIASRRQFE